MRCVCLSLPLALACALAAVAGEIPAALYPRTAHLHWVWNYNRYSTQGNVTELLEAYAAHNIPVGGINIDSTWSTAFTDFVPDPAKFDDFGEMVKKVHSQYKASVILWTTSMVNVDSPAYGFAVANDFLVKNSTGQVQPLSWWHGSGGLVDYSNPAAVSWWHQIMDNVLLAGVDGWKCDGTDPYIFEYLVKGGAKGHNGFEYKDVQTYSDFYYRDFLQHTRQVRGDGKALIWSRPVDCLRDKASMVCWGYSPKDVMVAGWVGDDEGSWNGLRGVARKVVYSAWDGYANFGADIGGYLQEDDPGDTKEVFLRWAQFCSWLPNMENGGHGKGKHAPWEFDEETTTVYRELVKTHSSLSFYLQSVGSAALEQGVSTLTPSESKPKGVISRREYTQPTDFSYTLGGDIFVQPILRSGEKLCEVRFPAIGEWLEWGGDGKDVFAAGSRTIKQLRSLADYPVFVRRNALIPVASSDDVVFFTWFAPNVGVEAHFTLRETKSDGPGVVAAITWADAGAGAKQATVTLSPRPSSAAAVPLRFGFRIALAASASSSSFSLVSASAGCDADATRKQEDGAVLCQQIEQGATLIYQFL